MMNTEQIYHTELIDIITAVSKAPAVQRLHIMKMYGGVELKLLAFLTSAPHLRFEVMICSLKHTGLSDINGNAPVLHYLNCMVLL